MDTWDHRDKPVTDTISFQFSWRRNSNLGVVHSGIMLLHGGFIKPVPVCIEIQPEECHVLSERIDLLLVHFGDNFYSSGILHRKFHFYHCWDRAMGLDCPVEKPIRKN
jgi:hypothetical protein